eukprot:3696220-Pyramimonas_sp.AAC.1
MDAVYSHRGAVIGRWMRYIPVEGRARKRPVRIDDAAGRVLHSHALRVMKHHHEASITSPIGGSVLYTLRRRAPC